MNYTKSEPERTHWHSCYMVNIRDAKTNCILWSCYGQTKASANKSADDLIILYSALRPEKRVLQTSPIDMSGMSDHGIDFDD